MKAKNKSIILILTGVPGTGKDTIAKELKKRKKFVWISLNSLVKKNRLWKNKEKGCMIADLKKLKEITKKELKANKGKNVVVDGHLACEFNIPADLCVVLRTNPKVLRKRLQKREYKKQKIEENILCEELDYCTQKAEANLKCPVYEVRTDKKISESINDVIDIIENKNDKFRPGKIDWSKYLLDDDLALMKPTKSK